MVHNTAEVVDFPGTKAPRPKVEVRGAPFDALVMRDLYAIADMDEALLHELVVGEMEGHFSVGAIYVGEERVGSMIWSFMWDGPERIFVCNALAAETDGDVDLLGDLEAMFRKLAKGQDCTRMRL